MNTIEEINALHAELVDIGRKTLAKAIRIGELLTAEKEKKEHGDWLSWLKANISFNKRTVQNYMRLFENRDAFKNETVSLTEAYSALIDKKKTETLIKCIQIIFENVKKAKLCPQLKNDDISRLPAYIPIIKQFILEMERLYTPEDQFVEPIEEIVERLKEAA